MPSTPRRPAPDPVLPLDARRTTRQRARWFHYSVALSLAAGLLSYAPPGFIGDGEDPWWWPFGGGTDAPEQESVEVIAGDGTAEMEPGWDVEVPEAPGAVDPEDPDLEPIEFAVPETEPQTLDLQTTEQSVPTGYVEGASKEQVSERTETTTVFENPDGTKTLRIYQAPAFTESSGGEYVPIDPTLELTPLGRWVPEAAADVSFALVAEEDDLIRLDTGEGQIAYGLSGAAPVPAQVDGHEVLYEEILPETDMRFTVAGWGAKADIVLNAEEAATSWVFPLSLDAVSAVRDEASGSVQFLDSEGAVVAVVPAGFAEDSKVDPLTGEGARTNELHYEVIDHQGSPALRVSLDRQWFDDPDRVFPITVDPTLSSSDGEVSGDTYVMDPFYNNYSGEGVIKIGTVDGLLAAGLLKFEPAMDELHNKYIRGATLNLYNTYSWSCTDREVTVHRITESWSPNSMMSWPGPSFDSDELASETFAYGYGDDCGREWATFTLDPWQFTRWVHFREPFHGFRIEASHSDEKGWKKFASRQTTIPSAAPFIDVVYSDQAAKYSLPSGGFTSPVTAAAEGTLPVTVTNWGSDTWQSGSGYHLRVKVYDREGNAVRASEGPFYAPEDVSPHESVTFTATVAPLQPGSYKLSITMVDPQGNWFSGSPYYMPTTWAYFNVVNASPYIAGNNPGHGAVVDSNQPTLWVHFADPDTSVSNAEYQYKICRDQQGVAPDCRYSGWRSVAAWKVPADYLTWGERVHWYAQVSDGTVTSDWTPGIALTPQPAQPPITSNLAGAPDGSTVPGLNPQVGNFTTTVTDAHVAAVGPTLAAVRTYNSQDLRTDGAFGTGWSTPWDQRLIIEPESTVLAVLESGRTVRFGQNPDGTFASPLGESLELQATDTGFLLRNTAGETREFDSTGHLVRLTDAYGREQTLTYTSGRLTRVTDELSGRFLALEWTDGHVTAVETPPAAAGGEPGRWTYTYEGDLLVEACSPLSALDCTAYEYESTSFYAAAVQDANPKAYYTFDEPSLGETLINRAADAEGEYDGDKIGLLHTAVGGALAASDGRALDLGAGGDTVAQLPDGVLEGSVTVGIELWFRAEIGERGTIFSIQLNDDGSAGPGCYNPLLYIDTDGRLRSGFWMDSGDPKRQEFVSSAAVDDGRWHHVVLTSAATRQWLYLDGAVADTETGRTVDQYDCIKALVGNGWGAEGWAGMPAGSAYDPYSGELDELSLYTRTLTAEEIALRYEAGMNSTARMTAVVNDQDHAVYRIDYDKTTGRVASLTDVNGAQWQLSAPQLSDTSRLVTLTSSYGKTEQYEYDAAHNGRIISRTDGIGTVRWEYNTAGFVAKHIDETGHTRAYATDEQGRRLAETVCRTADDCSTSYTEYYTATDPFDLRDGRVLWTADGRSADRDDTAYRTTYTYNSTGQLLTTVYPGETGSAFNPGGTASVTYTAGTEAAVGGGTVPAGLTATVTDEAGVQTRHSYNAAGDLVETLAPSGQATRYGYDLLGRLVSTQVGSYADGQFQARDTVIRTLDALGHTIATTGTAFTNPVTGDEHRLEQSFAYDEYGRLSTTSSWDEADPLAIRTTTYTYDDAGRLVTTAYPDGSTATRRWNSAGLLAAETTATGLELLHTYDERGRLVTTSAAGEGVDPTDPTATELLLEYRTYYDNDWPASTTDALGRTTSWEYWGDGTVKRDLRTAPDGTETVTARYEYDGAGNPVKTTDAVGTVTRTDFNARNWPTMTVVDPEGIADATHFAYDTTGRTTGITSKYGGTTYRVETFDYDAAGNVTGTVTTAAAVEGECRTIGDYSCVVATTANTYNSEGFLATAQVGDDGAESYTYNSLGQVQTVTGVARDVWIGGVDEGTQAPVTTYGYNAFGELTHLQDAAGNVTETEYDTSGRPVRTLLPGETVAGSSTAVRPEMLTDYRPGGLVAGETGPRGAVTAYEYDRYGRTLSVTGPDPDGEGAQTAPVTAYTYDRAGQVIEQTDPNGALSLATYDEFGRLATATATERVDGELAYFTTGYTYDDAGRLTAVTTPGGHTTAYAYDRLGRRTTVTDATGIATTIDYPTATGATTTFADGGDGIARRQSTTTDVLGNTVRQTSEIDTGTGWTSVECAQTRYGLAGRVVAATTIARGTCTEPDTTYTYDAAGQLTAVTGTVGDSSAITVALGYDLRGNRTRMVDGNGNATVYGFNDWGLQTSTVEPATAADPDPADRTWTTVYDLAGNAVEQHLPGGVVQTAAYDLLGRKTTESGTGAEAATTTRHYTWDAVGNLTGFSSALGDTDVTYNDRGLMTAITGVHQGTFAYDADGRLIERTDAAGTTGFTYDEAGRLATLTDPLMDVTHTYTWRGDGQLGSITTGSVTRAFTYHGYGQLASDTITAGAEQRSIAYQYDGQLLTAKTTTGLPNEGTQTYAYDTQGRLTGWTDTEGIETTYTWDAASNRVAVNRWDTECGDQAATTRLFVYDERNRLTEAMDGPVQCVEADGTWQTETVIPTADETWTYSPRGTVATHNDTDGTTTYAFDAFEQLKTASVDGITVTNQYDALGRLLARNGAGFAYDGLTNNLVAAPTGTSGVNYTVRDSAGGAVSGSHDGITGLSWTDAHGDLLAVINPDTGDLVAGGGFDPFGNPLPETTETTTGFQGGYTDPVTGQVNAHTRWYDPATGAFTSRDTWQLAPTPVSQTNRYLYGNASPLILSDPSGHRSMSLTVPATGTGPRYGGAGAAPGTGPIGGGTIVASSLIVGAGNLKQFGDEETGSSRIYTPERKSDPHGGSGYDPWDIAGIIDFGNGTLYCTYAGNCWVQNYDPGSYSDSDSGGGSGGDDDWFGNGNGAGDGRPIIPVWIDWNALETRPENTAQEAADDAPSEVELLNGALMNNEELIEALENENIVTTDDDGNITNINWRESEQECDPSYTYFEATWEKASGSGYEDGYQAHGAFAYLCGSNLKQYGSSAEDNVQLWNWPSENVNWGSPLGWVYDRCHLIGHQLGGLGDTADNLVTCFGYPTNRYDMRTIIENPVRKRVEKGNEHIIYISMPQYNEADGSLSGIRVIAIGNKGFSEDICFENSLGNAGIKYGQSC